MDDKMFRNLKATAKKDLQFNADNAGQKAIEMPNLYQKYLDFYIDQMREMKELQVKIDFKYGELYKHYKFEDNHSWGNKGEIETQINSNSEFYELKKEMVKKEFVIKYLEEVLDNIKRMSFSIKNFIDLEKFKAGMY